MKPTLVERFRALQQSLNTTELPMDRPALIAIAASTGGPEALRRVLGDLPPDLPACIVIVQHILPGMSQQLAEQLDRLGGPAVRQARDGDPLRPGEALLGPSGQHIRVVRRDRGWAVHLSREPQNAHFFPSADVLFASVAENVGARACGVILTGMGDDGARGLGAVRAAGGFTIAQDAESSAIYGMPRRAVELGSVCVSLPLSQIGATLSHLVREGRCSHSG